MLSYITDFVYSPNKIWSEWGYELSCFIYFCNLRTNHTGPCMVCCPIIVWRMNKWINSSKILWQRWNWMTLFLCAQFPVDSSASSSMEQLVYWCLLSARNPVPSLCPPGACWKSYDDNYCHFPSFQFMKEYENDTSTWGLLIPFLE